MAKINDLIAEKKYEDAAEILYTGVQYLFTNFVPNVELSREEFDQVAPYLIKKMETPESEPSEPTDEPGDDVVIKVPYGKLEITFEGPEDDESFVAPAAYEKNIRIGGSYSYAAPTIDGYVATPEVVEGKMTANGVKATITYEAAEEPVEPTTVTLTITYVGPEGDTDFVAPAKYEATLNEGEEYMVTSPEVTGYTPDKRSISGAAQTEDINEVVTYAKDEVPPVVEKFVLTVNFAGPEGDEEFVAPEAIIEEFDAGSEYSIAVPEVEGYTPDVETVEGTISEDTEVTVTYTKDAVEEVVDETIPK